MSTQTTSNQSGKASSYLKSVRSELKKVSWPTRKELLNYTGIVLLTCTVFSIFFYAVDSVFHLGLKFIM